jgi:DNA-binding IclR family transcriptional regulator
MPGNELVQSLVRAIDILSLVAEREEGVRLNELTTLTGIGKTTIYNLLRTLRFKGFVCKDRFDRYHLGPALRNLCIRNQQKELLERIAAAMQVIVDELPACVVTLCELEGYNLLIKMRLSSEGMNSLHNSSQALPIYGTASGICLLANHYAGEELQMHYPFADYGSPYWQDQKSFIAALEETRRTGFAEVPAFVQEQRVIAAMCSPEMALGVRFPLSSPGGGEQVRKVLGKAVRQIQSKP